MRLERLRNVFHSLLRKWGHNPLLHYIARGRGAGFGTISRYQELYHKYAHEINEKGLFDEDYYREQVKVDDPSFNGLWQYFLEGHKTGFSPFKGFDPHFYIDQVGDISEWDNNPLLHYLLVGEKEGIRTQSIEGELYDTYGDEIIANGLFDEGFYRNQVNNFDPSFNCLRHYFTDGAAYDLRPYREFDPNYYRKQVRDLSNCHDNPILHYYLCGKSDGIKTLSNEEYLYIQYEEQILASGLFDEEYYREQVDVFSPKFNAMEHYVIHGEKQGLRPNKEFDPNAYCALYRDVNDSGLTPFIHYVVYGRNDNRRASLDHEIDITANQYAGYQPGEKTKHYEEHRPVTGETELDCFAYYLPQFHPIPENNAWWGEGFTEWTNVTKAQPSWTGHIQPLLPGAMGFYDLRLPDVMREQAALAKDFNVKGFCFYYYWFAGKKLLDRPLELFLKNKDIDVSFFLCWANENWSRRWDGQENEILMAQNHSPDDDVAIINDISRYCKDDRYYRINGKPLIIVYRVDTIPDPAGMIQRWREQCRDNGVGEIAVAAALTFETRDVAKFGFDFVVEFPPHNLSRLDKINDKVETLRDDFVGNVFTYSSYMASANEGGNISDVPMIRTAMPSWDNTARRGARATVFQGATPEKFQQVVENKVRMQCEDTGSPNILMVNAWNEWAEGTVLEPSSAYGYANLNHLKRALCNKRFGNVVCLNSEDSIITDDDISLLNESMSFSVIQSASDENKELHLLTNGEELLKNDYVIVNNNNNIDAQSIMEGLEYLQTEGSCGSVFLGGESDENQKVPSSLVDELSATLGRRIILDGISRIKYDVWIIKVTSLGYVLRESKKMQALIDSSKDRADMFGMLVPELIKTNEFEITYR